MASFRIKELCKERGMTLSSLSERVAISQPSMSLIVSGKQNPSLETLEKIASALGVGIGELFDPSDRARIVCPNCGHIISLMVDERERDEQ